MEGEFSMKIITLTLLGSLLIVLQSCTMFKSWRSIPAPGGCEQCHKVPISANWQVSYRPATIDDGTGRPAFQQPESLEMRTAKPDSAVEKQKLEGLACFECHNAPDSVHKPLKGKFHH
jgi:hypothetical protein